MRRRTLLLVLTFLLGASHAHAQQAPGPRRTGTMPRAVVLAAPDRTDIGAPVALDADAARRSSWKYPLVGAALGVVAGIGYGAYLHSRIEPGNTLSGPPAYFMTVPLGAIGGLVLGMIGNSVHPSDAR